MKMILLAAFAAFVILTGYGAYAIHEIVPSDTFIVPPGPDAGKLNDYIVRQSPYRAWDLWPKKGKLYKGQEPHGSLLTTFVNDAAMYSLRQKKGMADGSIIAKENYTADKKFLGLSVMYKIKGFNPEGGDWFWAFYSPDGKVQSSGKVKSCIDCHSKKRDNDYIYTGDVKK